MKHMQQKVKGFEYVKEAFLQYSELKKCLLVPVQGNRLVKGCSFIKKIRIPSPDHYILLFAGLLSMLFATSCDPVVHGEEPAQMRDTPPEQAIIVRPDDVVWQEGPESFEPGSEFAVLEGDPGDTGVFNMRIKMPDGFVIAPHTHPNVERVTVLAGTFNLGHGETLDEDAAEALEAGSYFSLPPEMPHFAIAERETIIQLKTIGPWVINYINPEDDPRLREAPASLAEPAGKK
ncbi:cupin domain-containing protein [Cytophagaceae bacterium ABcell3]|nr:cupin domain-containing protein [Cytophagaceae bacterium ABcell3]